VLSELHALYGFEVELRLWHAVVISSHSDGEFYAGYGTLAASQLVKMQAGPFETLSFEHFQPAYRIGGGEWVVWDPSYAGLLDPLWQRFGRFEELEP